jgi:hypothetical protein
MTYIRWIIDWLACRLRYHAFAYDEDGVMRCVICHCEQPDGSWGPS